MSADSKHTKDLEHYLTVFRGAKGSTPGQTELPFLVFCRRRRSVLDIADCAECPYCDGIRTEGNERAYVTCRYTRRSSERRLIPPETLAKPPVQDPSLAEWPIFGSTPLWLIMKTEFLAVPPELSVETLRELFLVKGVSAAAVVDEQQRPLGVVSKTDLLEYDSERESGALASSATEAAERREDRGFHEVQDFPPVEQIMMPFSCSLPPEASVARAAAFMAFEGVHSVLVVNAKGKLVGFVSSLDILGWFARESGFTVPEPIG